MLKKLWLWKNFVNGNPEFWAFDNPYPRHNGGDPMVIGVPVGYAIFKDSVNAYPEATDESIILEIAKSRPVNDRRTFTQADVEAVATIIASKVRLEWHGHDHASLHPRSITEAAHAAMSALGEVENAN
jgi:hypothetical protein